jgi:hypothetical protein
MATSRSSAPVRGTSFERAELAPRSDQLRRVRRRGLQFPVHQRLSQCAPCATEDTVTPHASFIALPVLPDQAYANIESLLTDYRSV